MGDGAGVRGGDGNKHVKDKLDQLFSLEEQIHEAFGYQQQWRIFPIVDMREFHWHLEHESGGTLRYWNTHEQALARDENHEYEAVVYTQRHLEKWVYRAEGFVMILMDTHCDMNIYLGVFDEAKELKELPEEPAS